MPRLEEGEGEGDGGEAQEGRLGSGAHGPRREDESTTGVVADVGAADDEVEGVRVRQLHGEGWGWLSMRSVRTARALRWEGRGSKQVLA